MAKKRDREFLSALKRVYDAVFESPLSLHYNAVREICAQHIKAAFTKINFQIKGSEYLPYQKNAIFIYNHLRNDPYFTVHNDFQITLDSHFISSFILDKYYKDSGVRVVRHSLPNEYQHKAYYERLKYIRVYAHEFIPEGLDKEVIKTVNQQFYNEAMKHLGENSGLVFSPEGNSYSTGDSPGIFRYGIFRLACRMDPQPWIVPLVMANFDKLPSEAIFKCEIKPPFKMSDLGITNENDPAFPKVVRTLNNDYRKWVNTLQTEVKHFESEIIQLEKRVENKNQREDMVVFYGSSTIRLWKNLAEDFPKVNTLNLGFGGALISSLSQNFKRLFSFKSPKAIVLYLGGNDLSLGWSAQQIVNKIKTFISEIHQTYPTSNIINLSIKPSFERSQQMEKIIEINSLMKSFAESNPFLKQIDFFDSFMLDGEVDPQYFLQDGLHLNSKGYKVLQMNLFAHI